jgi:acetyltransferase-like isoleucine patch superfamily enzyme
MRPGKELRENYLPTRVAKVKIEDHCFIGVNCVIMPGVKIKEGSVVVSGSIVMSNTKKYTVFSGNPAKKLKELTPLKTEDVG